MQTSIHISEISHANSQYPEGLRYVKNPPGKLFVRGTLADIPCVAIVGSRHPSDYGKQVTYMLACELATAGVGIVSGLAMGIDAIAHQAALEAGGYTVAVLGTGLDQVYPVSNRKLAKQILDSGGALVSEYEAHITARKQHFPARNRIIAGISQGVLVTEAKAGSGAFHTTNSAVATRPVMAVPGNIYSPLSAGTNKLLSEGAIAVTQMIDVLNAINLPDRTTVKTPNMPADSHEGRLLELIAQGITTSQELIEHSGLGAREFAQRISLMELTGRVRNLGAGVWVKRS